MWQQQTIHVHFPKHNCSKTSGQTTNKSCSKTLTHPRPNSTQRRRPRHDRRPGLVKPGEQDEGKISDFWEKGWARGRMLAIRIMNVNHLQPSGTRIQSWAETTSHLPEQEIPYFLLLDISMIKTTNTNPWDKLHFGPFWCFFGVQLISVCWRIWNVKLKNMMLAGFIYFPYYPDGPRILKAAGGSLPRRWRIIKFHMIDRFPLMVPSSVCEWRWQHVQMQLRILQLQRHW